MASGAKHRRKAPAAGRTLRASVALERHGGSLERRLRARVGHDVSVRVHDNVHTMLSFGFRERALEIRAHHMFLTAPRDVIDALARYIRGSDPEASGALDRFIQRHRARIRRVPPHVRRSRVRLQERGEVHDLAAIKRELEDRYFGHPLTCAITWGPSPRARLPRQSIKLGSYSADAKLIRIHPALDQPAVPRVFVDWIVYHELLHHVHRAIDRDGRRCVHTPAFLADERRFPGYEEARAWERRHLELLLSWDGRA